ncbi:LysM peptidoglycan-binding and 3D domain-containing protein [Oceanobacillus halotolerans]|uniref:LysM peptidoglycan-binding and 3D domain-containing protein n=1 Tax=Oceanobacillus halotolerans TaxID=2663380 RepID=UPI0013DB6B29|nr:3D domain-containing protein [Oceanobacillus halotolerans]
MKKIVAMVATGLMIVGATVTSASAEKYEVEKGDNLWNIAQDYNTTVDDLVEINKLKSTVIHPKQKLALYYEYIVQKGDTLSEIGKDFNVSVEELKEWNDLKSDLIVIGQALTIKDTDQDVKEAVRASNQEPSTNGRNTTSTKANNEDPSGKTITVSATAYTADCDGCSGITATGVNLNNNPNAKVIAVDPNVIPLGSEVYVEGYGYATAADVGGAIKGNKIDLHVSTKKEAFEWGVRTVDVTIVE